MEMKSILVCIIYHCNVYVIRQSIRRRGLGYNNPSDLRLCPFVTKIGGRARRDRAVHLADLENRGTHLSQQCK